MPQYDNDPIPAVSEGSRKVENLQEVCQRIAGEMQENPPMVQSVSIRFNNKGGVFVRCTVAYQRYYPGRFEKHGIH